MRRIRHGFSLVELMIVVAIIAILAAIAIPNYFTMRNKAKRAEVPGNVDGIKTAEVAYDEAFDGYLPLAPSPATNPGKAQVEWAAVGTEWATLGWSPDGKVRGLYGATLVQCTQDPNTYTDTRSLFCVTGRSDVDGDGVDAEYYAGPQYEATIKTGGEGVY